MTKKAQAGPDYSKYTKKQLQNLVRTQMKKVNKSISLLEKEAAQQDISSQLLKETVTAFRKATGTKSKRKIATGNLSRFSKKRLIDIANLQRSYLENPRSTQKGRKAIFEKQYQTLKKTNPELTKKQLRNFQKVMATRSESIEILKESKYLDSEQILEMSKRYEVGELVDATDDMIKNLSQKQIESIPDDAFADFIKGWLHNKSTNFYSNMDEYYSDFKAERSKKVTFTF